MKKITIIALTSVLFAMLAGSQNFDFYNIKSVYAEPDYASNVIFSLPDFVSIKVIDIDPLRPGWVKMHIKIDHFLYHLDITGWVCVGQ